MLIFIVSESFHVVVLEVPVFIFVVHEIEHYPCQKNKVLLNQLVSKNVVFCRAC